MSNLLHLTDSEYRKLLKAVRSLNNPLIRQFATIDIASLIEKVVNRKLENKENKTTNSGRSTNNGN